MQLVVNEPEAFGGMMARYGKFSNVKNYLALIGTPGEDFAEKCGYYGEKVVIKARQLGLHSCWVGLSFSKKKSKSALTIAPGEKLLLVVSLDYGTTEGNPRKTKSIEELSTVEGDMPDWFKRGMEAAQLAPTAMNQQKFRFILKGNQVLATPGSGFYTKTDLGIAKYHFEAGADSKEWQWG